MISRRQLLATAAAAPLTLSYKPVAAGSISHRFRLIGLPVGTKIVIHLKMFGVRRKWETIWQIYKEDLTFTVPALDPDAEMILVTRFPNGDGITEILRPAEESTYRDTGEIQLVYFMAKPQGQMLEDTFG